MSNAKDPLAGLRCVCMRCNHDWLKRVESEPVKCPSCKSVLWNTPRRRKGRKLKPAA